MRINIDKVYVYLQGKDLTFHLHGCTDLNSAVNALMVYASENGTFDDSYQKKDKTWIFSCKK